MTFPGNSVRLSKESRLWTVETSVNQPALRNYFKDELPFLQVPVSPFDKAIAIEQIEVAYSDLLGRSPPTEDGRGTEVTKALAKDGAGHPRIIRLAATS